MADPPPPTRWEAFNEKGFESYVVPVYSTRSVSPPPPSGSTARKVVPPTILAHNAGDKFSKSLPGPMRPVKWTPWAIQKEFLMRKGSPVARMFASRIMQLPSLNRALAGDNEAVAVEILADLHKCLEDIMREIIPGYKSLVEHVSKVIAPVKGAPVPGTVYTSISKRNEEIAAINERRKKRNKYEEHYEKYEAADKARIEQLLAIPENLLAGV